MIIKRPVSQVYWMTLIFVAVGIFVSKPSVRQLAARIDPERNRRAAADSQQIIEAADSEAAAGFGGAVAINADTLAVGAKYFDFGGIDGAGAVYLFQRDPQAPTGWAEVRMVHADPPVELAYFGEVVALWGDTLVVGSPLERGDAGFAEGAAFVFERDQGGAGQWGLATPLADETAAVLRYFGGSVAVSGDLIAVGAFGADSGRGRVYLYDRTAGWTRVKTISDPNGLQGDNFGAAVSLDGDTLVVGARYADYDANTQNSGAAFVFERDHGGAGQWGLVRRLVSDHPQADSLFAGVLELDDDRVIIGAPREDHTAGGVSVVANVGAAFLYNRDEGGAGQWGLEAALRPADGVTLDYFGSSVALAGERAWIGAPDSDLGGFEDQGIIYSYILESGAWVERPKIEAIDGGFKDNFGVSLAVSGDELVAGAAERTPNGAAYVIDTAEAPAQSQSVFLPVATGDLFASTGTLVDGHSLESPEGAIIGAVSGSLSAPIDVSIGPTGRPFVTMPAGFAPRGDYFLIRSRLLTITPSEKPLLVGLPVPAGTDTAHLAVALLIPDRLMTEEEDEDATTRSWATAPGHYDPATNLFVTTVSALLPEGVTLVLFENPDNGPLPAGTPSIRQADQEVEYIVRCDPVTLNTDVCEEAYYLLVADELKDAHETFVDIFDFEPPRLVHLVGRFTGSDKIPRLDVIAYYGAVVAGKPCTNSSGVAIDGRYTFKTLQLLICIDPLGSTDAIRRTVRHELFHAVQAAYPIFADDRLRPGGMERTAWLMEGTATAAERSGHVMLRSPRVNLRRVTDPLLSIAGVHEYQAQDFWVYNGLEGPQADHYLSYLRPVFESGATPEHVNSAMDLANAYWTWAKNQVFEHHQPMDGAFDLGPCEFDPKSFDPLSVKIMNYPAQISVEGTLPPLTTAIVEIRITDARNLMPVGASSDDAINLRYKVYEIGEENCQGRPDGARILQNIPADSLRYVVLSNASFTNDLNYVVEVD